ncbi:zinc ribbon domain-containing protein [Streptomyces sp. NPDC058086]|uniref:zinc ribbon domain-containing protein n=1 Tax=Streptomyces sp. NPDC058086 TaxID=3346334 RepID=UPI0036EEFA12
MSLLVKDPASGALPATDTADGRLARSGPEAAWLEFRSVLRCQAQWYGGEVFAADRWFPSSRPCSDCEGPRDAMRLHVRTWACEGGITHDRDVSTARSLLAAGLAASACGASTRPQRNTPGGQSVMKQVVPRRGL